MTVEDCWGRVKQIGGYAHKHVPLYPLDPESKTDNRVCMPCAYEAAARDLALAAHDERCQWCQELMEHHGGHRCKEGAQIAALPAGEGSE